MSILGLVALGMAGLFTDPSKFIALVSWVDGTALPGRNAKSAAVATVLALLILKMYEIWRK